MEWADKWQPDMFAKPNQGPPELPEPPDHVEHLRGLQRLTKLDKEEWYISELLGNLQKNGFLFKYSALGGWGAWPTTYLAICIAIAKVKMEVLKKQKYRADMGGTRPDNRTTAQKAEAVQAAGGMIKHLIGKAKRKFG